jgi:anti-anti-sigma factor
LYPAAKKGEIQMAIRNWSDTIILVDLKPEPEMGDELKALTEIVRDRGDCDVAIDFQSVDLITSSSLSRLINLRKLISDSGHRLVLCGVAPATKGIFTVRGLDGVFEMADDKFVALASLQTYGSE